MTPQRVAYVVNVFPKVSETFIARELAELRRRGIEVRILSLRLPSEELRHGVVEASGLIERTVYDDRQFADELRRFAPELIHAHFATQPTATARKLAAALEVPFTFTAHRYDIYARPPADFADRVEAAAAVVTVAEANACYIEQTFGVPRESLRVIPSGVDTELFRPGGDPASPPHIVCVARLHPAKNHGLLLEACAQLRDRGAQFRCVLVGDGKSRQQVQENRSRLSLEPLVTMVGAAEETEVLAWWKQAAVGVLASDGEGFPVSLMEAAACGVPAVATAVGGVPELIEDGVTGLVVPPRDVGSLVAALERLLGDPYLRTEMGQAARRRAEECFSLTVQVERLLDVWADVLARWEGP